jgi:two-component system LytT family response regulator
MITAIIIDDEAKGRLALRQKLKEYCPDVRLDGEAEDGEEGLKLIESHQPDVVFLDIEMPRLNGFDMLQRLPQRNFHLVFTTAYDHYAIKAIRFSAFDYLLKPVDIEELRSVIGKIKKEGRPGVNNERLEMLTHNLRTALNKLAIPTMEGILFFDLADIIHIEARSNYTVFSFSNRPRLTVSKTLKEFEDLLPPEQFFRPHHSHIINLRYIKRYIKGDGGQVEMQNGDMVDVSRKRKEEFLRLVGI